MTITEALAILGLERGCTPAELKKQYRDKAKKHHPDITGQGNHQAFLQINEAYELLTQKGTTSGCKLTHTSIFNFRKV